MWEPPQRKQLIVPNLAVIFIFLKIMICNDYRWRLEVLVSCNTSKITFLAHNYMYITSYDFVWLYDNINSCLGLDLRDYVRRYRKCRYFNNLIKRNRYLDSFSVSAKTKFTENCFVFKPQCKSVTLCTKCTTMLSALLPMFDCLSDASWKFLTKSVARRLRRYYCRLGRKAKSLAAKKQQNTRICFWYSL